MTRADDQKGVILLIVMLVVFIGMLLLAGGMRNSLLLYHSLRHHRQQINQRWVLLSAESIVAQRLRTQLVLHHSQLATGAFAATGTVQDSNGQAISYQVKDLSGCFNLNWLLIETKKTDGAGVGQNDVMGKNDSVVKNNDGGKNDDGVGKNVARDWINAVLAKQGFSPLPLPGVLRAMLNGAEFTDASQLSLLPLSEAERDFLQRISCVWPIFSLSQTSDVFKININAITHETLPLLAEVLHISDKKVALEPLLLSRPATGWHDAKALPPALADLTHNNRYLNFGSHHYLLTLNFSQGGEHFSLVTLLYFYRGQALVYRRNYFIDSGERYVL
ncbi:general secretion pathway protein GspK [Dickeya sp. CFBP 2040]|uniref:type II secretion system protein GspK n=1 Tax=Dickeya sp. CFBP 2040 TaxID=2718531 RepID=UPI0014470915|nr:type II secretion system protein GspK [Dickeya sp. CFBP 2040]NKI74120.1 general secretion pathway protein GspK [Dickeya sp. CFBP 2040]